MFESEGLSTDITFEYSLVRQRVVPEEEMLEPVAFDEPEVRRSYHRNATMQPGAELYLLDHM